MKIGILSMQAVPNYGSFLQAYALKTTLQQMGHDCSFVPITKDFEIPELKRDARFFLKKIMERFWAWDVFARAFYHLKFRRKFVSLHRELGCVKDMKKHYDMVIIGSDEVFNCAQSAPWGFSRRLMGDVPEADRTISYAGSFGHTTYEDIIRLGLEDVVGRSLCKLSKISVRDRNSSELVKRLVGVEPEINVDPVFIYGFDKEIPDHVPQKDYIIVYSYPGRIKDKREIAAIKRFARDKGKELISIGFYFPWCDKTVIPHPFEVLAYFRNADFIITDTFHGTVMSIKMNRPFATIIRNTNSQKLSSLLALFSLNGREVVSLSDLTYIMDAPVDWEHVNDIVREETDRALEYLSENRG